MSQLGRYDYDQVLAWPVQKRIWNVRKLSEKLKAEFEAHERIAKQAQTRGRKR